MRFTLFGDVHLKMWDDTCYDECGIPLKLTEILNCAIQVCEYSVKNNITNVVIAGDVNDLKGIVHYKPFVLFSQIIKKYHNLHFYILSGNHDESNREDIYSAIQLLEADNVTLIYRDPLIIDNIAFVPWRTDLPEVIKDINTDILISHFGVSEASFSSGISLRTSIGLKDLKKFKLVLLGHYHLPQNLDNVYYTGSMIQLTKGEAGEEKRFLDVETETNEVTSIPFEEYRKYYSFELKEEEDIKLYHNEIQKLIQENNYVTVYNHIEENDVIKKLEKCGGVFINEKNKTTESRGIKTSMNLKEQCVKYLEINGIILEREEYMNVIIPLFKE